MIAIPKAAGPKGKDIMESTLSKRRFFRGFLYALCGELTDNFLVDGPEYHRAFAAMIEYAQDIAVRQNRPKPIEVHVDPLFGVYREANEMLLEGQQDLLLSLLNPTLRKATFRIKPDEAKRRLEALGEREWYRDLAKHFAQELTSAY
jgi:hypothetical protein